MTPKNSGFGLILGTAGVVFGRGEGGGVFGRKSTVYIYFIYL